ncbi:MAG: hypothetical protein ACUVSY_13680 [Roseiflexus sp.]
MFWCLVIPAGLVTLLAIAVVVAPWRDLRLLIAGLLRGCSAIVLLSIALLLAVLALLLETPL